MKKLRERFDGATPAQMADEAFQVKAPYLDGSASSAKAAPSPAMRTCRMPLRRWNRLGSYWRAYPDSANAIPSAANTQTSANKNTLA